MLLKVPNREDPYSVIGQYIRNHITIIEDIIATIELDGSMTNELFMVDMEEDGYFVWQNDWYEGEQNVALIDFFPISEAMADRGNENETTTTVYNPKEYVKGWNDGRNCAFDIILNLLERIEDKNGCCQNDRVKLFIDGCRMIENYPIKTVTNAKEAVEDQKEVDGEKTVGKILETLDEEQRAAINVLVAKALEEKWLAPRNAWEIMAGESWR